jgi:hypothetical protein
MMKAWIGVSPLISNSLQALLYLATWRMAAGLHVLRSSGHRGRWIHARHEGAFLLSPLSLAEV